MNVSYPNLTQRQSQFSPRIRSAKVLRNENGKTRVVEIPEELVREVVEQCEKAKGEYVFPAIGRLSHFFNKTLRKAGIEKFDPLGRKLTAHSFRHTFARLMAESVGHNPFVLKQLLGHSQITTTDRYCYPTIPAPVIDVAALLKGGHKGWTEKPQSLADEAQVQ